jgi:NTP pyrophosphatase (non-canonical NTP hydrolase)
MDSEVYISFLKKKLLCFRDDRNWSQFHKPKDLAMAVSIEANELLERFLWKSEEEISAELQDPEKRQKIVEELADVFITAINFANATDIDISSAVSEKIEKNAAKYPVEKASGTAKKYDEL